MDEVFGRDTEASGGHLFGLAAKRDAFVRFVETAAVFAAFPRVASGTEFVHGQCQGFVRFLADGAERHGTGDEMLDDVLHGFHLVDVGPKNERELLYLSTSDSIYVCISSFCSAVILWLLNTASALSSE